MTSDGAAGVAEVATLLHQGGRETMEDRLQSGSWWWALADGMGGEGAGDRAASAAVQAAATVFARDVTLPVTEAEALRRLRAVGVAAQQAVVDAAFNADVLTAGSTLLVLLVSADNRLHVGWIGDSRAYLVHGRELSLLTDDHTWLAATGGDGPSPLRRGALTRHLGYRALPVTDTQVLDVTSVDQPREGRALLCSDGVWAAVTTPELQAILVGPGTATSMAADLHQAVLDAGAPDNFAAVIIDFEVG